MVKVRNPKTLGETKSIASTEELEFNAERKAQNMLITNKYCSNVPPNSSDND